MAELTQAEADALLALPKRFVDGGHISLLPGAKLSYDLEAVDSREMFLMDLWRGTLRLARYRYQTRGRVTTVLARLDVAGAPHTNPDGGVVGPTHIHLYREGYDDRWAFPVDPARFVALADAGTTFGNFCRFCGVTDPPLFQGDLL